MTVPDDLDRRIGAFLADTPVRAPERTIDAVLGHARAHPRRRDPFAILRRDPMAAPWGGSGRLASVPLVAVVGLVVVAGLAGAAVGGLFDRGPAVGPVVGPTPSASVRPSAPSIPPAPSVVEVDLVEAFGADASVDVHDASGTLVTAESGQPGDGGSVEFGVVDIGVDAADASVLVLTWIGTPCDTTHRLDIAPDGRTLELSRPSCAGDSIPRDLVLRLRFAGPVRPADVSATIVEVPAGG